MKEILEEVIEKRLKSEEVICVYVYTPICGTCQVATRMLSVVKEIVPSVEIVKTDVNYARQFAENYQIESVPCLLLFKKGQLQKKIYAFRSVPYLIENIQCILEQ